MDAHLANAKQLDGAGRHGPDDRARWLPAWPWLAHLPPWNVVLACALAIVGTGGWRFPPLQWVSVGAVAAGCPQLVAKAWGGARSGIVGIHALILIATCGSLALGEPIDAGLLLAIFAVSEWLEGKTLAMARKSLEAVVALRPESADVIGRGATPVEAVHVGDLVAIRPGDRVPVDGRVRKGTSLVNESSLTGEARGVPKAPGARVFAGTVNADGYLEVEATAESADSTVAKLADLIEQAQMQVSCTFYSHTTSLSLSLTHTLTQTFLDQDRAERRS